MIGIFVVLIGGRAAVIRCGDRFNPELRADFNKIVLSGYKFARRRNTGRYKAKYEKKIDN